MKKFDYHGKTAVVTGASSGIGAELVKILVEEYGVKVIGVARNLERLNAFKNTLKNAELFTPFNFDVGSLDGFNSLTKYLKQNNLKPELVINCAGILPHFESFNEETDYLTVLNTNFLSVVYSAKTLLPFVKETGGLLINVSSSSALCPFAGISMYTATKSATQRFSESLRCENKDCRIVTVMPGFTKTDILNKQTIPTKEAKIIDFISASSNKVASKILKKASKNKGRIVIGKDAHFMSFLYRFFPSFAPKFITKFLKNSNFETFKDIWLHFL